MMEKPSGRRHDAFTDYHQRIQMGDEVHGFEAEAVSPCLHAQPDATTFHSTCAVQIACHLLVP